MMRKVLTVLAFACATDAAAQQIPIGSRVKVRVFEPQRQVETRLTRRLTIRGELTAMSAESLWIRPTPMTGVLAVPKTSVRRLYQSRGVPSRVKSMLMDGVGGAVLGALEVVLVDALVNTLPVDQHPFGASTTGDAVLRGAGYGFAIFGFVGFALPVERWRHRSLDGF